MSDATPTNEKALTPPQIPPMHVELANVYATLAIARIEVATARAEQFSMRAALNGLIDQHNTDLERVNAGSDLQNAADDVVTAYGDIRQALDEFVSDTCNPDRARLERLEICLAELEVVFDKVTA